MTGVQTRPAAILFVDICGSTAYFDRFGEEGGRAMVERCMQVVVPRIVREKGRVVKFLGDGLLAVFDTPSEMVAAVSAAHSAMAKANDEDDAPVQVRIHSGGHYGPVAFDPTGDVFGDVVNTAARVQGVAAPDQIYVTEDVVRELLPFEQNFVRRVGLFPLRGKEQEIELHEVMWNPTGATVVVARTVAREEIKLLLQIAGQSVVLTPERPRLTIGRVPGNDLVVDDSAVSREHAEVSRRKGLFYFIDRSTNGTYFRPDAGRARHLHHEEMVVEGSGCFSLGRSDGPEVRYKIT